MLSTKTFDGKKFNGLLRHSEKSGDRGRILPVTSYNMSIVMDKTKGEGIKIKGSSVKTLIENINLQEGEGQVNLQRRRQGAGLLLRIHFAAFSREKKCCKTELAKKMSAHLR